MNAEELKYFKDMQQKGWEVGRNGWPDFIMIRDNEVRLIELKCHGSRVSTQQKKMHEMLYKAFGIKVEVIKTSDIYMTKQIARLFENVKAHLTPVVKTAYICKGTEEKQMISHYANEKGVYSKKKRVPKAEDCTCYSSSMPCPYCTIQ